jgi:hypothetical protein
MSRVDYSVHGVLREPVGQALHATEAALAYDAGREASVDSTTGERRHHVKLVRENFSKSPSLAGTAQEKDFHRSRVVE